MLCCQYESKRSELYHHIEKIHNLGLADGRIHLTADALTFVSFLSPHKNMNRTLDEKVVWWKPQMYYCKYSLFFMVLRQINSEVLVKSSVKYIPHFVHNFRIKKKFHQAK